MTTRTVLLTETEAERIHYLVNQVGEDEPCDWIIGHVFGKDFAAELEEDERDAELEIVEVPDAIGPRGELLCKTAT